MTNLLIAVMALMPVSNDGWELKTPFKEKLTLEYDVLILIDAGGMDREVEILSELKIEKKTDKGFEGSFGFTEIYVDGESQPAETWPAVFGANGMLKTMEADELDTRRMYLPFFMVYPGKTVAVGDTWKYSDKEDEAVAGHRAVIEYKVISEEKVGKQEALKIEFKLKEEGPAPMTGDGHYWINKEGVILKYKMNLSGWPVPMVGQSFDAEISGEIVD